MKALSNEKNYRIKLAPLTGAGNPARVDGLPVWSLSNEAGTLEVEADGLSALLRTPEAGSAPAIGKLTITADADLGDGVKTLTYEEDLAVGPGEAESLGIEFEAVDK